MSYGIAVYDQNGEVLLDSNTLMFCLDSRSIEIDAQSSGSYDVGQTIKEILYEVIPDILNTYDDYYAPSISYSGSVVNWSGYKCTIRILCFI